MKTILYIVALLLITSCAAPKMTDSWSNKDYINYQPKKVLIVGLTDNLTARKMFEEQLKAELKYRGIDGVESYDVFKPTFTSIKQTEKEIETEVKRIKNEGFDAILISAVKGVEDKELYSGDAYIRDYYWRRFGRYYYMYQDVYLIPGYYNKYKIYNIEASLYDIKENNDKSLVWVASYDLVDPKRITTTVTNYVSAIINSLEEQQIILKN